MSNTIQAMNEKRNILANQMKDIQKRSVDGVMPADDHQKFMQLYAETEQIRQSIEAAKIMTSVDAFGEVVEERTQNNQHKGKNTYEGAFVNWLEIRNEISPEDQMILRAGQVTEKRGTATQVVGTNNLGGYTVPQTWDDEIMRIMRLWGGVLSVAKLVPTDNGNKITTVVNEDTEVATIVAELGAATVKDTLFSVIELNSFMYNTGIMKASVQLLRDSKYNIAQFIKDTLGERMGVGTNLHFTTGTGSGQPQGVVTGSTLGATHTGVSRAKLIALKFSVPMPFRGRGSWMMNSNTLGAIAALSIGSGDDRPLWSASMRDGEPDRLEGSPIVINEQMPDIGSGLKPVLFGDFSYYHIRKVGEFEIFPFNELFMVTLEKGWMGYAAWEGKLYNAKAINHLVIS